MSKLDRTTLDKVLEEIQNLIDENYPCDNIDQSIGYQLALYKMYNKFFSMKLSDNFIE